MPATDLRHRMAATILGFEARRDPAGHLAVYHLPGNDGGGRYEVAGINERYNKAAVERLVALIDAGKFQEAEDFAVDYIARDTDPVATWHTNPGVLFYLRDCCFNRGAKGAARILQRAAQVGDDGDIGDETRRAIAKFTAATLLGRLRIAREDYERNVVGYRANLWNGLVNRWDKALVAARKYAEEAPEPAAPKPASKGWLQALLEFFAVLLPKAPPTVPAAKPSPTLPPWLSWAQKEVGFHEKGANLGIEKYIALAHCGSLGDPWCAIFANAGLEASGIRGTRSAMARSFEHDPNFVKLEGPALGAITTMWRGSLLAGTGHVFYYLGENANGVLALGGNQSDEVCRQYEPRARIVGHYWPKSVPLPKIGRIIVSDEGATGGSET